LLVRCSTMLRVPARQEHWRWQRIVRRLCWRHLLGPRLCAVLSLSGTRLFVPLRARDRQLSVFACSPASSPTRARFSAPTARLARSQLQLAPPSARSACPGTLMYPLVMTLKLCSQRLLPDKRPRQANSVLSGPVPEQQWPAVVPSL